jgi:hypothetical protein
MSDLPDLPAEPTEPVPHQLRLLASVENLGTLHSVHQPTSWLTKAQSGQGRIYLYDQGFVLGRAAGGLALFRWGQMTVRKARGGYLITGADRRSMVLSKKWSNFAELEKAITAGVADS